MKKYNLSIVSIALFISIIFIEHNAYAKRIPFKKFYYPSEYSKYQFSNFGELKSQLTTKILRSNDVGIISENFNQAQYTLACLGKMKFTEDEKFIVRQYLLGFFMNYLTDSRFKQLLNDYRISQYNNNDETFYYDIIAMPSNILCVIAALNPQEEDIMIVGDFCMKYDNCQPIAEQYLISFFSDLFYFKSLDNAKKYLEKQNFSSLSMRGKKSIKGFQIAISANTRKNQRDTWLFLLQEHLKLLHNIKSDTIDFDHDIFEFNRLLTEIFLSLYQKPNYNLLIELSKETNPEKEFFFTLQLFQLIMHQSPDKIIKSNEKEIINNAMQQFLNKNKHTDSKINKKIYELIFLNDKAMQKRINQ